MSSPPPASPPMVWPPSNPSDTVIPFQLPWGQTGCCPPGGMDALMKCYCDIQQASAFIGQIMLDQINNNPATIAAIIAGIEKSGSSLPTVGVTNGSLAQPGQVGEFVSFSQTVQYTTTVTQTPVSMGVLQPGDWDMWYFANFSTDMTVAHIYLDPPPPGASNALFSAMDDATGTAFWLNSTIAEASFSVPSLIVLLCGYQGTSGAGQSVVQFNARRRR